MLKNRSLRWTSEYATTLNAFPDDGERDLVNDLLKDLLNSTLRGNHNIKEMYSQRFLDSTTATTECPDVLSMYSLLSSCYCVTHKTNGECADRHSLINYIIKHNDSHQQLLEDQLVLKNRTENPEPTTRMICWNMLCKDFLLKPDLVYDTPQTLQYAS